MMSLKRPAEMDVELGNIRRKKQQTIVRDEADLIVRDVVRFLVEQVVRAHSATAAAPVHAPEERKVSENISMYTEIVPDALWRDAHTTSTKVWDGEIAVPQIQFSDDARIMWKDATSRSVFLR